MVSDMTTVEDSPGTGMARWSNSINMKQKGLVFSQSHLDVEFGEGKTTMKVAEEFLPESLTLIFFGSNFIDNTVQDLL